MKKKIVVLAIAIALLATGLAHAEKWQKRLPDVPLNRLYAMRNYAISMIAQKAADLNHCALVINWNFFAAHMNDHHNGAYKTLEDAEAELDRYKKMSAERKVMLRTLKEIQAVIIWKEQQRGIKKKGGHSY